MIEVGKYHSLAIKKFVDFGAYLDAEGEEILLPKRYLPKDLNEGDMVDIFLYHDNEGRLIATTDKPLAAVGEIALMKVVSITPHGAFVHWGIMKDVFVPLSQQVARMQEGNSYLIYLFIDSQTGRVTGTEKFQHFLSNEELTVTEKQEVDLTIWQKTDIGYKVIINNKHIGVIHFDEVFRDMEYGETLKGFIKTIRPENKLDVVPGEPGYKKVPGEKGRILQLLDDNNGYLPYNDKSSPDDIYSFFAMSKKTFKMTIGGLYKDRLIDITTTGIKRIEA